MPMGPVEYIPPAIERYVLLGYDPYRYYQGTEPPPWTPLNKPLSECRLGVIATAGTYVKGQAAFFYKDDHSYRAIPKSTSVEDLRFSHVTEHYLGSARQDPNSAFPIDSLRRLESDGVVAEVAEDLFSCMGGVYSQRKIRDELAPALAAEFTRQEVDAVLLVPM
jgi:D-proline reductase (dithiol) PrdB